MTDYASILSGNDLRSIGRADTVVKKIKNQHDFDDLFNCLFCKDRRVVMRSADAIEKITIHHPEYLLTHTNELYKLLQEAEHKELKWHIALLITRVPLGKKQFEKTVQVFINWALDKNESKIVRVNAIQGLFDLSDQNPAIRKDLFKVIDTLKEQQIPSINARIRKLLQ